MPLTDEQLAALDREVQIALDRRHSAALVTTRAGVPDASPLPRWPGVPEGSGFLPVAPTLGREEIAAALRPYRAGEEG